MKLIKYLFLTILILITSCSKQPSVSKSELDNLITVKILTNSNKPLSFEIINNSTFDVFYYNNRLNEPDLITEELVFNRWQNKGAEVGCGTGMSLQTIKSGHKVILDLPSINDNPFVASIFLHTKFVNLYTLKQIYRNF